MRERERCGVLRALNQVSYNIRTQCNVPPPPFTHTHSQTLEIRRLSSLFWNGIASAIPFRRCSLHHAKHLESWINTYIWMHTAVNASLKCIILSHDTYSWHIQHCLITCIELLLRGYTSWPNAMSEQIFWVGYEHYTSSVSLSCTSKIFVSFLL